MEHYASAYSERVITLGTSHNKDNKPLGLKHVLQFAMPALIVVGFLYLLSPKGFLHTTFFDSRQDAITEVLEKETPLGFQLGDQPVEIKAIYSQEYMEWMESLENTKNIEQWDELVAQVKKSSKTINYRYYIVLPNHASQGSDPYLVVKDGNVLKDGMRPLLEGGK